jgi:hypothetical protein
VKRIALHCLFLICFASGTLAQEPSSSQEQRLADAGEPVEQPVEPFPPLPPHLRPAIEARLEPAGGVKTGEMVRLTITAEAREGDDVTVPDQSFGALEVHDKQVRIEKSSQGRKRFVFQIELLALEPGEQAIDPVQLRVVTAEGTIGSVETRPFTVSVQSRLGNEPNAELKPPSEPVTVMQDDYTLLYVLGTLLAAAMVIGLTLWFSFWWQRRPRKSPPPPPPRPPWEVALEKLGELERLQPEMLEKNQGSEFVDRVSDVVREYLGGRFFGGEVVFDGLETTSEEMIETLRRVPVPTDLLNEVSAYLYRCDLVKFAKVVPDLEEASRIWQKAGDIVRVSMPRPGGAPPIPEPPGAGQPAEGGSA